MHSACKLSATNILIIQTWKHSHPSFTDAINQAIEYHQENKKEIIRTEAERVLIDYILGLNVEVTITETVVRDPQGEVISTVETRKEKTIPPPVKLLQEILYGEATEEGRAIATLGKSGVLPKGLQKRLLSHFEKSHEESLEIFEEYYPDLENETSPGITDKTDSRIRAKILGIDTGKTIEAQAEEVE